MAIPVVIPRLGWNMEEGIFLGWLAKDGDPIRSGSALFRLEGEKATEDVECHDSGILRLLATGPSEGDKLPVGAVIGYLLQPGETEIPSTSSQTQPAIVTAAAVGVIETAVGPRRSTRASPRARRTAAELGLDWTKIHGSGRNGRIREKDVRAVAETGGERIVPLTPLRRRSAERLATSAQATVPVTLTTTCDATSLSQLRRQSKGVPAPTITDVFVKASALALGTHPLLAARWADDHLVLPGEINVGVAVDTDAGLLVPVVRQPATLTLREVASQTRELIDRARTGKSTAKDLQGGVFTITNLGMFGIDAFTPVINWPECAILGIGRIRRIPVVVDDTVEPRDQITLSLTFDHRIVDGAPAARFLQTLVRMVEDPNSSV